MDTLQMLHDFESYLGYDLTLKDGDDVLDYLGDDPMDTNPVYLSELFGFRTQDQIDVMAGALPISAIS